MSIVVRHSKAGSDIRRRPADVGYAHNNDQAGDL